MSAGLVRRLRRLSEMWRAAAEALPLGEFAKRADAFARADTFHQCAASLERARARANGPPRARARAARKGCA